MQWSLVQVKEHPLWRALSDKERRFFELLETHALDEMAAVVGAFELSPQSINSKLNQIRAGIRTGFLYRAMMGFALPTREELAAEHWKVAQSTKDEARKERCLKAAARILGYEKGAGKDPSEEEAGGGGSAPRSPDEPDLSNFQE